MILWDIASGERLRTFEGHDRGLACIEFKVMFFFVTVPKERIVNYFNRTISSYLVLMTAR